MTSPFLLGCPRFSHHGSSMGEALRPGKENAYIQVWLSAYEAPLSPYRVHLSGNFHDGHSCVHGKARASGCPPAPSPGTPRHPFSGCHCQLGGDHLETILLLLPFQRQNGLSPAHLGSESSVMRLRSWPVSSWRSEPDQKGCLCLGLAGWRGWGT